MILDAYLWFTGTVNGASGGITSTNTGDAPTTGTQVASNIIDIGVGSVANPAIPSPANGGGARDLGIGDKPTIKVLASVSVAFASGTSLQLDLSGAPDSGSATPGSYTVMWTSAAYAEADLDVGAQLGNIGIPLVLPGQVLPRYLRLRFITVGTHTAGVINCGLVIDRFDQIRGTDSALSGYPAGINIAN